MADKKKKWSEGVADANDAYVQGIREGAQQVYDTMTTEGDNLVTGMQTAQQEQDNAYNEAQRLYRSRMDAGMTDFADIVAGEKARIDKERQDAQTMIAADNKAAQWSGLTELASSVANLIGVGGHNAVSQQYKSYSQDWMRKADQDMREHRYRMDNINARLNALRQQQAQLKMGDAKTALDLARQDAERQYNNRMNLQQATYNARVNPAQYKAQAEEKAGEAALRGAQAVANTGLAEESRDLQRASLGLQQQRLNDQREEARLSRLASGFVEDENGNLKYDPERAASTLGVKSLTDIKKGSGTDKTDEFPVIDINGNVNTVKLTKEERQNMFTNAPAAIRRDLGKEEAAEFKKQLDRAVSKKDEKRIEEVYAEWIGKSPTMRNLLLEYDPNYRGDHGTGVTAPPAQEEEGGSDYEKQRDSFLSNIRKKNKSTLK